MELIKIKNSEDPYGDLSEILARLHVEGPSDPMLLESLSYYKKFHNGVFLDLEEEIVSSLGLFYKNKKPSSLYSFLMSGFGRQHKEDYGEVLTPVQASIRRAVDESQYISISAPTSAGKSYSIRDFIAGGKGDAVVVVPSRALIAEYVNTMKRKFHGDKNVLVSSFVDRIYIKRNLRRIFVITPERSKDLFFMSKTLNVEVFFFDEAQVSEEVDRGVVFDVMVRRVKTKFPNSKMIFAHPFVDNPEAQFEKHGIEGSIFSKSYEQGAVGKICIHKHSTNKNYYYFSPYLKNSHHIKECVLYTGSFKEYALNGTHKILVYVSKSSIYNGTFLDGFREYVDELGIINDPEAIDIADEIKGLIGSDENDQVSDMVSLLKKGVVIHHGSVPLEVRFLIEDFIRGGFAKLCFATSTLAQGVNMPFDIVWLENSRFLGDRSADRALSFKNLIGRSGRLTEDNVFDYGYVYTKNAQLFTERISTSFKLKNYSLIDDDEIKEGDDANELLSSIRNDSFDEILNIPISKVERLSEDNVIEAIRCVLDALYRLPSLKESISGKDNQASRTEIHDSLKVVYEASLDRPLFDGESSVFKTAISIFLLFIQGWSFREITGLRYSLIANKSEKFSGYAKFSQPAKKLPDSRLINSYPLFSNTLDAKSVRFDAVVFDTYDYLDQVISFSLIDIFIAAFGIYIGRTQDVRAANAVELMKFGTNDSKVILLIRYGFPPDIIGELLQYIEEISEFDIVFKEDIDMAPQYILDLVDWYLP
jgi:helicase